MSATSLWLVQLFMLISSSAFAQHSEWNLKPDTLMFSARSASISAVAKRQLSMLKDRMAADPDFKVVIEAIYDGSDNGQQLSWNRVNAVIEYMASINNIDRHRFIFKYRSGAPVDSVIYRQPKDGEEGPSHMPRPVPGSRLRRSQSRPLHTGR